MAKRSRTRRPQRAGRERPAPPRRGEESPDGSGARHGRVITLFSGACEVESEGRVYECVLPSRLARDQRFAVAVGDEVAFAEHGEDHRVARVLPRRTALARPDPQNPRLERVVAANVDVVVQVSSVARPPLRRALIDRYLITIGRGGARPLLCVNKIDLLAEDELARELEPLDVYREMGLTVLAVSARTGAGIEALRAELAGRTAVFAGHSGVGKSSLLRALEPDLEVAVGEVTRRYARGRHTTSRSRLYRIAGGVRVIDTPGIRELGLGPMTPQELCLYFPDFDGDAALCRFSDCTHTHEPDCAVRLAVDEGRLSEARWATYVRILESLDEEIP